jgi:hypothetical protein
VTWGSKYPRTRRPVSRKSGKIDVILTAKPDAALPFYGRRRRGLRPEET